MVSKITVLGKHKTKVVNIEGYTSVWYWDTIIVSFSDKKIILNSGGYWTNTTKKRMNQASCQFNLGYHVWSKQGIWYVTDSNGETSPFQGHKFIIERQVKKDEK